VSSAKLSKIPGESDLAHIQVRFPYVEAGNADRATVWSEPVPILFRLFMVEWNIAQFR
jgi:hypothetical protein